MSNFGSLYERLFLALGVGSIVQLALRVHEGALQQWWSFANGGVFVVTLIAFLIGNTIYLASTYSSLARAPIGKIAGDAALLLLHGGCFFAMARSVSDAANFNSALIALCFADAVWLLYDPLSRPQPVPADRYAPRSWILINAFFGLILIVVRLAIDDPALLSVATGIAASGNRVADFLWTQFGYRV